MKAAIERTNGEIVSRNYFAAWLGYRELGYEVLHFERGRVDELPLDPEMVVVGGIPTIRQALKRLGVECP